MFKISTLANTALSTKVTLDILNTESKTEMIWKLTETKLNLRKIDQKQSKIKIDGKYQIPKKKNDWWWFHVFIQKPI